MPGTNLPAIILAAGRGERLRPLTDRCPKPLLPVAGRPMIEWHLEALARDGVRDVVVNTAWLEDQFPAILGSGSRWGLRIHYSTEGKNHGGALETAGGIATALQWLGEAFWVVSGDVWMPGFRFDAAWAGEFVGDDDDAWIWLVPNPAYHASGDFDLDCGGRVVHVPPSESRPLTYANVALMRARLVGSVRAGERAALGPLLCAAAAAGRLAGRRWRGAWHNIGTVEQWQALQERRA